MTNKGFTTDSQKASPLINFSSSNFDSEKETISPQNQILLKNKTIKPKKDRAWLNDILQPVKIEQEIEKSSDVSSQRMLSMFANKLKNNLFDFYMEKKDEIAEVQDEFKEELE